ncbi:hypothetical protein M8J75_002930 [Diaphorina citri]|nr:hypothetical protein M8J75_002930 [Diaphorina citri]
MNLFLVQDMIRNPIDIDEKYDHPQAIKPEPRSLDCCPYMSPTSFTNPNYYQHSSSAAYQNVVQPRCITPGSPILPVEDNTVVCSPRSAFLNFQSTQNNNYKSHHYGSENHIFIKKETHKASSVYEEVSPRSNGE